ncbi:uncharacterized protein At2g39920-like isoform X2 [Magnolia sinica]|nr:uncharacterized protein At2g39920-like isoform X2 [Magnolia sinica]
MGSRYIVESGLYMTSFAATVFVAALVTVGVLLVTLLIALTIMLESCQSKSTGVIEMQKASDEYEYCKIFALHAELNDLRADEFPTVCKALAIQYIKEGQYSRDLNLTMQVAESYFDTLAPNDDGLDVVLIDIDDIFPANLPHYSNVLQYSGKLIEDVKHPMHMFVLRLHMKLHASGWSLILFSRMPEKQRNATVDHLISAGYRSWSSLIMRSDEELPMQNWEYIASRRVKLHYQGFRIASVISSQVDALMGPSLGKRNFKLPNPIYSKIGQHIKGM